MGHLARFLVLAASFPARAFEPGTYRVRLLHLVPSFSGSASVKRTAHNASGCCGHKSGFIELHP